ncbi:MAG: AmmeMemoRadiSam system protein A [candidate division WOR-3 bacterium]|nr:AmmeMemoRadiSam system protein A [candidate division WOR-3 bacterium]
MERSEKLYLLETARAAIEAHIYGKDINPALPDSHILREEMGVFVTLKKNEDLRGCIGYIEGVEPLYRAVITMAVKAGFHDPRFPPLSKDELNAVNIEISVMTPLRKIDSISKINVGEHGIYLKRGYASGLLLPQVAVEWGYDRDQFLSSTCMKAGMGRDCYNDPETEIYIFSAEIFSEEEMYGD